MEILVGSLISLILQIGKKLGLSERNTIIIFAFAGSLIYSAVKHYASVNITFGQSIETTLKIFTMAIATYEIIFKQINSESLLGKIVGNR